MSAWRPPRPLLTLVGPTGSGKSDLAIHLAQRFGGEIVNCDSMQLYCGFDIGTAKTPPAGRAGIPHHLFDVLSPQESYSAGEYARAAREIVGEISGRGKLPVIVGGCASYQAGLHLMRTGAAGVLVGVGPGHACTTRGVLGIEIGRAHV